MFKKFSAVICFCLCFVFLSANGAFASGVRVNSIGSGALVPDEETDLNYNPAFVTYINGQRIYDGMDFSYEKDIYNEKYRDADGSEKEVDTESNYFISPYFEYVNGFSDAIKFAVKYSPSFNKESIKYEYDPDLSATDDKEVESEESKDKSPLDGRILIGFSLLAEIKLGYPFLYYKSESEYSDKCEPQSWDYIDKNKSESET